MKRFLALSILVFIVGFIGNTYAPDVQKFKVAVNVEITNKEDSIISEDEIRSYINRELRSLNDVKIVANDYPGIWKYGISVHIMEMLEDGRPFGRTSVSSQFLEKINIDHFTDHWKGFHKVLPAFYLPKGSTYHWKTDELDKVCKKVVAKFDTAYLEPVRKFRSK